MNTGSLNCFSFAKESLPNLGMQAVAVRVHRDDASEAFRLQVPHRFRNTELHEVDAIDVLEAFRIILRSAADGIQVNTAMLLQRSQRLRSHAAFADDARMPNFLMMSP